MYQHDRMFGEHASTQTVEIMTRPFGNLKMEYTQIRCRVHVSHCKKTKTKGTILSSEAGRTCRQMKEPRLHLLELLDSDSSVMDVTKIDIQVGTWKCL